MQKSISAFVLPMALLGGAASAQDLGLPFHPYYQDSHLELGVISGSGSTEFAGSVDLSFGIPLGGGFGQSEFGEQGGFGLNLGVRGIEFDGLSEYTFFGGAEYTFDGGNRAILLGVPDAAYEDYTLRRPFARNEVFDTLTGGLFFGSITNFTTLLNDEYAYGFRYDSQGGFKDYGLSVHFFDGGTTATYGGLTNIGDELTISTGLEAIFDTGDTDVGGHIGLRYEPASVAGLGIGATAGFPIFTNNELVGQLDLDYDLSASGGLPVSLGATYIGADGLSAYSVAATYNFTEEFSASIGYGDFEGDDLFSLNVNFRPQVGGIPR